MTCERFPDQGTDLLRRYLPTGTGGTGTGTEIPVRGRRDRCISFMIAFKLAE